MAVAGWVVASMHGMCVCTMCVRPLMLSQSDQLSRHGGLEVAATC